MFLIYEFKFMLIFFKEHKVKCTEIIIKKKSLIKRRKLVKSSELVIPPYTVQRQYTME